MPRKILCVMDAFWKRSYSLKKDTTILLLSEFERRDFSIFLVAIEDLHKIKPQDFDLILMRKDPPVDKNYLKALRLLEKFQKKTPVINNPTALLKWTEKSIILNFPQWIPPTLITKNKSTALQFLKTHKKIVLKPLNSYAGKGIRLITQSNQLNLKKEVMLQTYLPQISIQGEKRIFMINGQALGAILKKPKRYTFLANPDLGATLSKTTFTSREKKMCRDIGKFLKKNGIFFAGLDVIDGHLTEINFTSPGLLCEWNELTNKSHDKKVVTQLIKNL